jgi:hypothetical protein
VLRGYEPEIGTSSIDYAYLVAYGVIGKVAISEYAGINIFIFYKMGQLLLVVYPYTFGVQASAQLLWIYAIGYEWYLRRSEGDDFVLWVGAK